MVDAVELSGYAYNSSVPDDFEVDFSKPMPIFPLPGCVLLPYVTIPLHIFEPRYRAMTRYALESDQPLIAMALFEGENWRDLYGGKPNIRPFVGVGSITAHEELMDGRFNLSLRGVARARVVNELDHDPFRMANLEPIESEDVMEIDLSDQRDQLRALLTHRSLQDWAPVAALAPWLACTRSTLALLDLTAMHVCDVDQRYAMLAEADPFVRADKLIAVLNETKEALELAERQKGGQDSNDIHLN